MIETEPVPAPPSTDADDLKRMAPTYIAVVIIEVIVLAALWWFQVAFSR